MPNSLDLMLIVVMALITLSLLALCLMFFVRSKIVKKVAFYTAAVIGVYVCTVGLRIFGFGFPMQSTLAVLMALTSIAAVVLERLDKTDGTMWKIARILAAVSLIIGTVNAFS